MMWRNTILARLKCKNPKMRGYFDLAIFFKKDWSSSKSILAAVEKRMQHLPIVSVTSLPQNSSSAARY